MEDSSAQRNEIDWVFWIMWVAANTIGLAIALLVRQWLVGLILGIAQWLVLRNRFPRSGWWILATVFGLGVSWSPAWTLAISVLSSGGAIWRFSLEWPIVLGISGVVVGFFQWLILRTWVFKASRWILASSIAGLAGGVLAMLVFDLTFRYIDSPILTWFLPVITGIAAGLVYGSITGLALVKLHANPVPLQGAQAFYRRT